MDTSLHPKKHVRPLGVSELHFAPLKGAELYFREGAILHPIECKNFCDLKGAKLHL